jgi:hypothetical protein
MKVTAPRGMMIGKQVLAALTALVFVTGAVAQKQDRTSGATDSSAMTTMTDPAVLALSREAYAEIRQLIVDGRFEAALKALEARTDIDENDPAYFNLLGVVALKAGNHAVAVSALERVVLMQPDNAGAWLDLAIASAAAGHGASAGAYFDYVEEQFAPPPALRALIVRYRARLAAPAAPASPWRSYAEALAGVDTNANSGLRSSSIPLTFGAERVEFLLDPTFQARSDRFAQVGAGTRYTQRFGDNTAELAIGARTRTYVREDKFSTINLNASGGLRRPTPFGEASAWLNLDRLWLGGSALLNSVRTVVQIERPIRSCRLGVGLESESRRYQALSYLNSDIIWGQAGLACDWRLGQQPVQTILLGRVGNDRPTGDRPGGKTRQQELIAQIAVPFASGVRSELSIALASARDTLGYSSLLEQNATRRLDRRNIRLQLAFPLRGATDFLLTTEDNRFDSNLDLFRQSGKSVSVGIRQQF